MEYADLDNHHIEGFAAHGGARISLPLISHIEGNLWMGGCIGGVRLPDDFLYIVSLYPWEQYTLGQDTRRIEIKMYDAAENPDQQDLDRAVQTVLYCVEEGKTLVHCQAGLNRSGLVSALALIRMGHSPQEAVDLLRTRRGNVVLCNPVFENLVLNSKEA